MSLYINIVVSVHISVEESISSCVSTQPSVEFHIFIGSVHKTNRNRAALVTYDQATFATVMFIL